MQGCIKPISQALGTIRVNLIFAVSHFFRNTNYLYIYTFTTMKILLNEIFIVNHILRKTISLYIYIFTRMKNIFNVQQISCKSFSQQPILTTHLCIHHKEKLYNCIVCNKSFCFKSSLIYVVLPTNGPVNPPVQFAAPVFAIFIYGGT